MADDSKTEKASPKRREKAREQGSVVRSRELTSMLTIAGVLATLTIVSHGGVQRWTGLYRELLDSVTKEEVEPNGPLLFWMSLELFRWIVPVLGAGAVCSLAAQLAQGGFTIAPGALEPKPDRMNPAKKVGEIFSVSGLSNLLKSLLPFGVIAWVGASTLRSNWQAIVHASSSSMRMFASFLGSISLSVGWKCGLVLLLWSIVEYGFNWQKSEGDMKMSRQDLKEEMKQADGNPAVKAGVRRAQRQMRKRHSLKTAATATVVITNPTHYAVALRYEPTMAAPIVVAKGLDLLALQIREIAAAHEIPVMENRPLAQALYKGIEVGDAIPSALYQAVADILVIVFRAQAEVRAQEARRRARNASGALITP